MQAIKLSVTGNTAAVTCLTPVTAGTVGMPVEFTFDESWAGLTKTAVFRAGNLMLDRVGLDSQTTVPWELLRKPGCHLFAGVYGYNADGTVQIPTVWADLGVILPGADPAGEESADPSVPIWKQLQDRAQDMENALDGQQQEIAAMRQRVEQNTKSLENANEAVSANRTDIDNTMDVVAAMEQEVSSHSQTLQAHTEILAKQGFVKLAETILTEDATAMVWTQTADGKPLSDYKDFFIYWVGKFDTDTSNDEAWVCRANDGIMYYCYTYLKKYAARKGFWWHIEEIYNDGDKTTMWRSTFPNTMVGQYTKDFDYVVQGLADTVRQLKGDICYNSSGEKINEIHFGSLASGAKMVAGSKAMLLGRKR